MPLHPALQVMLAKVAHLPPMHTVPVATIRAGDIARYQIGVPPDEVASVEDRMVPCRGGERRVRIYRPDLSNGHRIMAFFHGSGFVINSIETHDAMCRQLCRRSETVVVSVDYRLAPEHKFPDGPDDCYDATLWISKHATELGGDPARLTVAGDSAGANMATVTALRFRDDGGPKLASQMLFYPVTDYYTVQRPSWQECATGYGLTRDGMIWFWDNYMPNKVAGAHPHASPIRAPSLQGLPRAYVMTAQYDILRDEGAAYADRLQAAGVPVRYVNYDDLNHGSLAWVGLIDRSTEAMNDACAWLKASI